MVGTGKREHPVTVFIDSNIPMYAAGKPHPHRDPSHRFLRQVETGELDACTSTEVLQEILHRYTSLGERALAAQVYNLFVELCPVVFAISLAETDRARDLLLKVPSISARDALHAAVMLNHEVPWIATFDTGFDRITGIRRWGLS